MKICLMNILNKYNIWWDGFGLLNIPILSSWCIVWWNFIIDHRYINYIILCRRWIIITRKRSVYCIGYHVGNHNLPNFVSQCTNCQTIRRAVRYRLAQYYTLRGYVVVTGRVGMEFIALAVTKVRCLLCSKFEYKKDFWFNYISNRE